MNDLITAYPLRAGETQYIWGDKIDVGECLKKGVLNEGLLAQLKRSAQIVEATPENMRTAVTRRPADAPWPPRGFTQAYLEERDLIDPGYRPPLLPAEASEGEPRRGRATKVIEAVVLGDDKIPVGKHFIQPKKNGTFTYYDAADAEGRLLRAKAFKKKDDAVKFLEGLQVADTSAPEPAETTDDSDLRSDAAGAAGQDPPADR